MFVMHGIKLLKGETNRFVGFVWDMELSLKLCLRIRMDFPISISLFSVYIKIGIIILSTIILNEKLIIFNF